MKIGRCFGDFDSGDAVFQSFSDMGYEYLEIPLCAAAGIDDGRLARFRERAEANRLPIYASNVFFPGSVPLLGEASDEGMVLDYAGTALRKASLLGIEIAVLGSGAARRRPDDMSADEASAGLSDIFGKIAELASGYGIVIALEPLNPGETNTITTSMEGLAMVERVGHTSFKLLLDNYHVNQSGDGFDVVHKAARVLRHCHLAVVPDRSFPGPGRMDSYAGFFEALRAVGYGGNISVESSFEGEADAGGVAHLKNLQKEA